jgi:predicted NAD-dependent protein-ADP-ribosyltransferase YbiA (DUF1768 family)
VDERTKFQFFAKSGHRVAGSGIGESINPERIHRYKAERQKLVARYTAARKAAKAARREAKLRRKRQAVSCENDAEGSVGAKNNDGEGSSCTNVEGNLSSGSSSAGSLSSGSSSCSSMSMHSSHEEVLMYPEGDSAAASGGGSEFQTACSTEFSYGCTEFSHGSTDLSSGSGSSSGISSGVSSGISSGSAIYYDYRCGQDQDMNSETEDTDSEESMHLMLEEGEEDPISEFTELDSIQDWRKMLSNSYMISSKAYAFGQEPLFVLDGLSWASVEHYFQANKFKDTAPDFYRQFSLESGSELSRSPEQAIAATGASGVLKKVQIRPEGVVMGSEIEWLGIEVPEEVMEELRMQEEGRMQEEVRMQQEELEAQKTQTQQAQSQEHLVAEAAFSELSPNAVNAGHSNNNQNDYQNNNHHKNHNNNHHHNHNNEHNVASMYENAGCMYENQINGFGESNTLAGENPWAGFNINWYPWGGETEKETVASVQTGGMMKSPEAGGDARTAVASTLNEVATRCEAPKVGPKIAKCSEVMEKGLVAKFSQNENCRRALLATKDATLVNFVRYFPAMPAWQLMKVREEISKE